MPGLAIDCLAPNMDGKMAPMVIVLITFLRFITHEICGLRNLI